jgi:hypothetical protein
VITVITAFGQNLGQHWRWAPVLGRGSRGWMDNHNWDKYKRWAWANVVRSNAIYYCAISFNS